MEDQTPNLEQPKTEASTPTILCIAGIETTGQKSYRLVYHITKINPELGREPLWQHRIATSMYRSKDSALKVMRSIKKNIAVDRYVKTTLRGLDNTDVKINSANGQVILEAVVQTSRLAEVLQAISDLDIDKPMLTRRLSD